MRLSLLARPEPGNTGLIVLSVSKVFIASIFYNHRNFETERDKADILKIKSLDLKEIYQFHLSVFVVTLSVPNIRRFEIERSILLRLLVPRLT